jgi:hypothetical protein
LNVGHVDAEFQPFFFYFVAGDHTGLYLPCGMNQSNPKYLVLLMSILVPMVAVDF